jgi:hypothetical protein
MASKGAGVAERAVAGVDLLDALIERAEARAYLWSVGEYELQEAVDVLQEDAKRDGLIRRIGQDGVQKILADAFWPYREADDDRNNLMGSQGVSIDDFYAYMPTHAYIYAPSREMWPASSVNARLLAVPLFAGTGKPMIGKGSDQTTMPPSQWLDKNKPVEQMT